MPKTQKHVLTFKNLYNADRAIGLPEIPSAVLMPLPRGKHWYFLSRDPFRPFSIHLHMSIHKALNSYVFRNLFI